LHAMSLNIFIWMELNFHKINSFFSSIYCSSCRVEWNPNISVEKTIVIWKLVGTPPKNLKVTARILILDYGFFLKLGWMSPPNIFTHSLYPCHCTNINYIKPMRQHFMHFKSLICFYNVWNGFWVVGIERGRG